MNFGSAALGIGSGIGQAMQNYQQQRDAQMRNMMLQLYMQNQQKQQQAKELEGVALTGGGLFGGGGMPTLPMVGGGGAGGMPGAAMPQPAAAPPMPADPGVGGRATGVVPLEDTPQAEVQAAVRGTDLNAPPLDYEAERNAAPSSAPAAPAAARGEGAGATSGGGLMLQMPNGQSVDLGTLFQRIDPTTIAQRIKQLRPEAAPDAIAMATESLYKMAQSGDRNQQLATATLLKYLMPTANFSLGEAGRDSRQAAALGVRQSEGAAGRTSREGIAEAGRAAAGERQDKGIASREGIADANRGQRASQFATRMQQADASRDANAKKAAYQAILRDIDKQLYPGLGSTQPSEEERAEFMRQRAEVVAKLRPMAGLPPLQAAPSRPLPGGGATAPLPPAAP